MFVGGKLGADARFNRLVKGKVLSRDVHTTVGKALRFYQDKRQPGESFADFAARIGKEDWQTALA